MNRPLFPATLSTLSLRHREVGLAKDLSATPRNLPLHVSSGLTAHDHEVLLCIYSNWYMSFVYVDWLLLPRASQHKRMTYTNCCTYRVVPPHDER